MTGRCVRFAALLFIFFAGFVNADPVEDEASGGDPDYIRGVRALEAKDWKGAIRLLSAVALRDTRNADVQNYLAYAYRNSGELPLAFKHYSRALELNPRHRGAHEYLGEAYLLIGNLPKAEEHLAALEKICLLPCAESGHLEKRIAEYRSRTARQGYPSKAIRFIAPFPPGGSSDVLCRVLGQKLSDITGQPVVVENRAGASGNIGHEFAARQAADGYTLVLSNNAALAINPHLFKRLGFDPQGDFAPVAMVASAGQVLVVHPSVPATSVSELIALAKSKPGQLHFGSGGKGIPSHIAGETFKIAAGVDIVHVPYKGTVQAVTDLVGGQLQLVFSDMVPAIPHIRAGRLRPLAVTVGQRSAALPEVPTMDEAGLPGFRSVVWWAVLAPKGTPRDIIARLNADFGRIVTLPEVRERYASLGVFTEHSTPQQVTERIRADTQSYARLLKAAGIEPE